MPSVDSQPSVQNTMSFLSVPQTFISVCLVMHLFHVPPDGSIHPGDFPPMSSSTNFATLESAIMSTRMGMTATADAASHLASTLSSSACTHPSTPRLLC